MPLELEVKESTKHILDIPKGSVELVKDFLEKAGFKGKISISFGKQSTGDGLNEKIKISGYNFAKTAVKLKIQPGGNYTCRECYVFLPWGWDIMDFAAKIKDTLSSMKLDDENGNHKDVSEIRKNIVKAPEMKGYFTANVENKVLVFLEMQKREKDKLILKKEASGTISDLSNGKISKNGAGPIIASYIKEGFLKPKKEFDITIGYTLTQKAFKLIESQSLPLPKDTLPKTEEIKPVLEEKKEGAADQNYSVELEEMKERLRILESIVNQIKNDLKIFKEEVIKDSQEKIWDVKDEIEFFKKEGYKKLESMQEEIFVLEKNKKEDAEKTESILKDVSVVLEFANELNHLREWFRVRKQKEELKNKLVEITRQENELMDKIAK